MPAIAPTSNPKAQVPGAAPGITTRSTSTNVSAGYKLSVGTVVNAYGQTVLNPGIGTMLAPLARQCQHHRNHQHRQQHHPVVVPVVLLVALLIAEH